MEQLERIRLRVEPYASALLVAQKATRGLYRHVVDSCGSFAESFLVRGRYGRKVVGLCAVLASAFFVFGSWSYVLTVACVVRAAESRHTAAPFDAILGSVLVKPGHRVHAGDILCQFDHRELDRQHVEPRTEARVLEIEQDRARAAGSPADVRLAGAKKALVNARLEVIKQRIARSTVRAPIEGVVIGGDLRMRIGSVVELGAPLFELAPMDTWLLELTVPERTVSELNAGMSGSFASFASPGELHEFGIRAVRPAAEVRDGRTVYSAEASLLGSAEKLRPGMEGVARVRMGKRPIWWIALHRTVDYLRMKLWL